MTGTQASGGPSGVPSGASAVLGNITVVPYADVALAVFAKGATTPSTSNVNASTEITVANNFTSKLGLNEISVFAYGGPVDFLIDIFGYYP